MSHQPVTKFFWPIKLPRFQEWVMRKNDFIWRNYKKFIRPKLLDRNFRSERWYREKKHGNLKTVGLVEWCNRIWPMSTRTLFGIYSLSTRFHNKYNCHEHKDTFGEISNMTSTYFILDGSPQRCRDLNVMPGLKANAQSESR